MQRGRDEPALSPVVEVALKAPALLVRRRDEPCPRAPQLLRLRVELRPQALVFLPQVRRRAFDQHLRAPLVAVSAPKTPGVRGTHRWAPHVLIRPGARA